MPGSRIQIRNMKNGIHGTAHILRSEVPSELMMKQETGVKTQGHAETHTCTNTHEGLGGQSQKWETKQRPEVAEDCCAYK